MTNGSITLARIIRELLKRELLSQHAYTFTLTGKAYRELEKAEGEQQTINFGETNE